MRASTVPGHDAVLVARAGGVCARRGGMRPEIAVDALSNAFSYSREVVAALREIHLPRIAINSDFLPGDVASLQRAGVQVTIMPGVGH